MGKLGDSASASGGRTAGGGGSALATGGMATKLHAAEICMNAGIDMLITSGDRPEILYDALAGTPVGTRFIGRKNA